MKDRLRIGIEVQRLFRKKKHGMEVVALEIIKQLQQIDIYNEYFIYVREDVDVCVQETPNFKVRVLPGKSYFTWEQFVLPAAVKKDNLDFLHSTCNTSAVFLSVPLLLTLHDIIYLEKTDFKGTAYQNFGNIYRRIIVPRVVNKSKTIITVSNFERNVILDKLQLPGEKVQVIYNAVNPKFRIDFEETELNEFRKSYALPCSFILFLGNTAPKKNTLNVIKAYVQYKRRSPEGLPIVILDFDEQIVYTVLEKLNASDLKSDFLFPGYISSDKMPLLYYGSTLFLYPSLRESFGLPILEAMACGAPVLTSNTSSMPEVSGDAAVLVDPYDVADIVAKMIEVLDSPDLRERLKLLGLKRAADFTWKAAAEKLLSIYHNMV